MHQEPLKSPASIVGTWGDINHGVLAGLPAEAPSKLLWNSARAALHRDLVMVRSVVCREFQVVAFAKRSLQDRAGLHPHCRGVWMLLVGHRLRAC